MRFMRDCPIVTGGQTTFYKSYCVLDGGPRQYKIECASPVLIGFNHVRTGYCTHDEVCMDRVDTATCVSNSSPLKLQKARYSTGIQRVINRVTNPGPKGSNLGLTLTGSNDDVFFNAQRINVAPRDVDNNTIAASTSCRECSRFTYLDSPANLNNFDINITLPNDNDIANLYGIDWAS